MSEYDPVPPPKPPSLRRVIQIVASTSGILALCADETMWELRYNSSGSSAPGNYYWASLPPIPGGDR